MKMSPAELAAAVERANRRLEGAPGFRLRCPRCGHEDGVPDDPEKSLYTCDQCGCRIAFGSEQPAIAVTPHADRRFVVTTFSTGADKKKTDAVITLDREYAAQLAFELLSVCAPGKWKALIEQVQRAHDVPGAPRTEDDDVVAALDAPMPQPEPQGRCACGAPSAHANGACATCVERALGGS